jgi:hypothetical protein
VTSLSHAEGFAPPPAGIHLSSSFQHRHSYRRPHDQDASLRANLGYSQGSEPEHQGSRSRGGSWILTVVRFLSFSSPFFSICLTLISFSVVAFILVALSSATEHVLTTYLCLSSRSQRSWKPSRSRRPLDCQRQAHPDQGVEQLHFRHRVLHPCVLQRSRCVALVVRFFSSRLRLSSFPRSADFFLSSTHSNHVYDLAGCGFSAPGSYETGSFDTCAADNTPHPPGEYAIVKNGKTSISTFHQGQYPTPAAAKPAKSSNCKKQATIAAVSYSAFFALCFPFISLTRLPLAATKKITTTTKPKTTTTAKATKTFVLLPLHKDED